MDQTQDSGSSEPKGGMGKVVGIVVAILILLGIVWFAMSKKSSPSNESMDASKNPVQTNQETQSPSSTSLKALLGAGNTVVCTYSDNGNTGTVYTANGKARTDISATSDGKTINMHSLMDGTTSYTWIDGQPSGYKMSMTSSTPAGNTQGSSSATGQQQVDPNKSMNYNCSAWTLDNSKFVLPAGVEFMDLSSMKVPGMGQ